MIKIKFLENIGNTKCGGDDGNMVIICNGATANIEEILLDDMLSQLGYKILSSEDFIWHEEDKDDMSKWDIEFKTDMPWDLYMSGDYKKPSFQPLIVRFSEFNH